jgi:hypothetical protein
MGPIITFSVLRTDGAHFSYKAIISISLRKSVEAIGVLFYGRSHSAVSPTSGVTL